MKGKVSWSLLWASVAVFIVAVCLFFIPPLRELLAGSELFLMPFAVFFLLGVVLIVLTVREKIAGMLKAFFLLTGASAAGIFVFILLHNAVYGLADYWFSVEFEEPFFFIMAILVCPLAFLVGAIGSIILAIKKAP